MRTGHNTLVRCLALCPAPIASTHGELAKRVSSVLHTLANQGPRTVTIGGLRLFGSALPFLPHPVHRLLKTPFIFARTRRAAPKVATSTVDNNKTRLIRGDDGREVRPERVDASARLRGDDVDDRN